MGEGGHKFHTLVIYLQKREDLTSDVQSFWRLPDESPGLRGVGIDWNSAAT